MNDLWASLKADLTSRRMLPLLAFAAIALVGALAYVALASKSGASTASSTPPRAPAAVVPLPGPAVASAPANPNAAVSETTIGAAHQHKGAMRNPFTPLPGAGVQEGGGSGAASSGSPSSGGSGASSGSGGSSAQGNGGSSGSQEGGGSSSSSPAPAPVALYTAEVKLQLISEAGAPVGKPQVFHDVKPLQLLPSKHDPLLVVAGAIHAGKQFVFVLAREAILHGSASCLPGPARCEAIVLAAGHSEELQYLTASGSVLAYRLTVTKIEKTTASAAKAASLVSTAGRALMARRHLPLPDGVRIIAGG